MFFKKCTLSHIGYVAEASFFATGIFAIVISQKNLPNTSSDANANANALAGGITLSFFSLLAAVTHYCLLNPPKSGQQENEELQPLINTL